MSKIPCSVEILTRNSALTLERCLESVKDFAEIIVLDGNSIDGTRDLAERYGCKIVKQYETDEPNVAIKDYSEVRNKGLRLATHDWFMYIDSDEYLSQEVVEEIRVIVKSHRPLFFAWWQPRKYVLNGKIIDCATTYPNQQIRLFHRPHVNGFIKPIHERIELKSGTIAGRLKNFEYIPVGTCQELKERWARYIRMEERMYAGASRKKIIKIIFRQSALFMFYTFRLFRSILFCRGVRMPLFYEWTRHLSHLRLAARMIGHLL